MKTIIIKSDESWKIVDQDKNDLSFFQSIVGGYIEGISVTENVTMYCNEEGKIKKLPINNLATWYVKSRRQFDDYICGDVVFSRIDSDGEEIGLDDLDINNVIDYIEIYQNQFDLENQ